MEEIKQEEQTQEVQQAQEVQQEVQQEEKQQEVQQEQQEAVNPDLVDPTSGKAWKELAKEYERKYHGVNERFINFQKQAEPQVDENEEIPATRAGIKQVLTEQQQQESRADSVFNDTMIDVLNEKPEFAPYKEELRAMIRTLPNISDRKNPETIKIIAKGLWGTKQWEQKQEVKPMKRIVAQKTADVMSPSSKSGSASTVILSDDEQEYRNIHRLDQKGYTDEEIREQYQRYAKKKS